MLSSRGGVAQGDLPAPALLSFTVSKVISLLEACAH